MIADMDPEAVAYALIAIGCLLLMVVAIAAWLGADSRAGRAQAQARRLRRRLATARAELDAMHRRYGATVDEQYRQLPPWTTRPRPAPAAETVIIPATTVDTIVMTAAGATLSDPT